MSELLYEMEPLALENGIPKNDFWEMTLIEVLSRVELHQEKKRQNMTEQAQMDYKMAQLMAYAMNEPGKMPSFEEMYPFVSQQKENIVSEEEKAQQEMRKEQQYMMMMARAFAAKRAKENNQGAQ